MGWWNFRYWACRKYPPSPGRPPRDTDPSRSTICPKQMNVAFVDGRIKAFKDAIQNELPAERFSGLKRDWAARRVFNGKQLLQAFAVFFDSNKKHAVSCRPRQLASVDRYAFKFTGS